MWGVRRVTVFGLDVWSAEMPPVIASAAADATGRSLDLVVEPNAPAGADAPHEPTGRRVLGEQRVGEQVAFRIEQRPDGGYLLSGDRYGAHLLTADGARLTCIVDPHEERAWQRFLIAQALPFAAVVNGLEAFHASGVVIDGRAVALLGPSGAGKTSLALALCAHGAEFLTDDVLAIELLDGELIAHAGSPWACVGSGSRERMVAIAARASPAVVTDVLCLARSREPSSAVGFQRIGDAGPLLSGTFNLVVRERSRLRRQLDVCAAAARRRVESVSFTAETGAERLAELVLDRLCSTV